MSFDRFSAPERQYSDIVSPQQGVEDRSAATKAAGQTQALANVGGLAVSAFEAYEMAEDQRSQALGLQQYESILKEEELLREQGVPKNKINAWRLQKEKEVAPLISFEDRLTLRSKYDKAFGGVLTEKRPQDQWEDTLTKTSIELGINPELPSSRVAAESYLKAQANAGEDAKAFINKLMPTFNAQLDTAVNSGVSFEDANKQVQILLTNAKMDAAGILKGDKEYRDLVYKQADNLAQAYLDSIDPSKMATRQESLNRLQTAQDVSIIMQDEDVRYLSATDSVYGDLAPVVNKQLAVSIAPRLREKFKEGVISLSNGSFNIRAEGSAPVVQTLSEKGVEFSESGEAPEGYTQALNTVVDQSAGNLVNASPDEAQALIEGLAGGIGEYYKTNPDKFPQETRDRFREAMQAHFAQKVIPIVDKAFQEEVGSKIGRAGAQNKESGAERLDQIDIKVLGDQIVFTTDVASAKLNVKQLNENISSDLSTYAKALANVSGSSLEDQAEILKGILFPRIEATVPEEAPVLPETTPFTEEQMQIGSDLLPIEPVSGGETPAPTMGDAMFEEVALAEGSGDDVTDVPTAHYGVTEAAAKAVGATFDKDMSEAEAKQISVEYLNLLDSKFATKVKDWDTTPESVKKMAIDAAYNMGEKVLSYKGFMSDLKAGKTADEVGKNLLDTANVDGKSLRGLATRRAKAYNKAAANKIVSVEQKKSGEIIYYDAQDRIIFSYKPSGGKHPDSKAMKENI